MKQTGAIEGMDQHGAQYGADAAPMGDLAALLVLFQAGDRDEIIAGLNEARDLLGETPGQAALIELVARMFDWIDQGALDDALAVIGALPPLVADAGFNLLIATIFPDGDPVLADLTDAALITMVALLATSGQRESAIAVLGKGVESRPGVTYVPKAHRVKGWIFGLDAGLAALLPSHARGRWGRWTRPPTAPTRETISRRAT
jgi:hypothetical protein